MAGVSVSTPSKENSPTYGLSKTGAAVSDKAQLNIASSILTQDVIDGLKDADESVQIKPLTLKIDKNTTIPKGNWNNYLLSFFAIPPLNYKTHHK